MTTHNHRDLCQILDGEVERTATGFRTATAERFMFVSYERTRDPATAMAICKAEGLLASKLDAMSPEAADFWYATTLPQSREND